MKTSKSKQPKTVAQILEECQLGDILSDKKRTWKVTEADDEAVVASPHKWKKAWGNPFELWNCGTETLAIIPDLHRVK
jgi:hypothetical protein